MMIRASRKVFELAQRLRNDVEDKIGIEFVRFPKLLPRLNISLEEVEGPQKGLNKSRRLIVVREKAESWLPLVAEAVQRSTHTLGRQINSHLCRDSMARDWKASYKGNDDQFEGNLFQHRHS